MASAKNKGLAYFLILYLQFSLERLRLAEKKGRSLKMVLHLTGFQGYTFKLGYNLLLITVLFNSFLMLNLN